MWKILLLAGMIGSGFMIGKWYTEANNAGAVIGLMQDKQTLQDRIHDLETVIQTQNNSVALAEEKARSAKRQQEVAERYAVEAGKESQKRMSVLQELAAAGQSCKAMLAKYWEMRR